MLVAAVPTHSAYHNTWRLGSGSRCTVAGGLEVEHVLDNVREERGVGAGKVERILRVLGRLFV
eukprot:scaffold3363_cov285-Prasinococcus_capsulatus_cf.AAC.4